LNFQNIFYNFRILGLFFTLLLKFWNYIKSWNCHKILKIFFFNWNFLNIRKEFEIFGALENVSHFRKVLNVSVFFGIFVKLWTLISIIRVWNLKFLTNLTIKANVKIYESLKQFFEKFSNLWRFLNWDFGIPHGIFSLNSKMYSCRFSKF